MDLTRNSLVASRFAAQVHDYERNAALQREVAESLAAYLPPLERPKLLEAGCGTGFFTRHLLDRYPNGDFLITDLAPEMVAACRARYHSPNGRALRFAVMDGEAPDCGNGYDLIALSMTLQWFSDPVAGLRSLSRLLCPGGMLLYATIGPGCLPEWRAALDSCGLRCGLVVMPELPGVCREETRIVDYGGGIAFLGALKAIGATTPRAGYEPLAAGSLRTALRQFEQDHGGRVTWRIVYGMISAEDGIIS